MPIELPDIWSDGQLAAFSGVDGDTDWQHPFVAHTLSSPPGLRFWPPLSVRLLFEGGPAGTEPLKPKFFTGDCLEAHFSQSGGPDLSVRWAFADHDTIVGELSEPLRPSLKADGEGTVVSGKNRQTCDTDADHAALVWKTEGGITRFAFAHSFRSSERALKTATGGLAMDVDELTGAKLKALESVRRLIFPNAKMERLYYKCACVARINTHSPQGVLGTRWSTPDRVPHKNMWLWDSCFHSFGYRLIDAELARDMVWAVLSTQREDGFIAHMMGADGDLSTITQPPLLAWTIWELNKTNPSREFLEVCWPGLRDYITWDISQRDANENQLLEWKISGEPLCRSGESGMDNSCRFDEGTQLDCVDFSVYALNELLCLADMAKALNRDSEEAKARREASLIQEALDKTLYHSEDGLYYDKTFDGQWVRIPSIASLLPLFAGCNDKQRIGRLVRHLKNPTEFWTPIPLPTIARNHPSYEPDMWRGPVWLNTNFILYYGLKRVGEHGLATQIAQKSVEEVARWYEQTGCVWEFYDADGETAPPDLDRKKVISRGSGMKTISDYNWTACLTMAFMSELYGAEKEQKGLLDFATPTEVAKDIGISIPGLGIGKKKDKQSQGK
ncbi:MAG TPA: trehalase family glycosidase [Candidatus Brocadiia bacterium]|nr:trehalase family glycosidase [Candidatus Brocadiia bacterium]